ncbi:efflux RND transporter periplasmic adaptor subunit [Helicobacter didelphidarum]|uniref:Efflux RND transporter periplasmic adaptor subunit n=1 Tax=Helicobacter didelphidarum TaxID=2040648 RepID=A0A3D8IPI8_9HELI|nr:efflux RND transporter periplasmic adaptor subunit [Helicobacter didelphidarum]RDU66521.1 efflux RND transporter periplasmic adaptor subunit [Helicobacter didelphidarum]
MKRLLCMIFLIILQIGCSSDSGEKTPEKSKITVGVQTIQEQNLELSFEYPARFKSLQSVEVYARVEGILLSQNIKEGDIVKAGDLLFKIDPARYSTKVDMARAQYNSAMANFTKANKDWQRVMKLYKQGVYTVDQYDTSEYNYQSAQASVANTKAALDDALIDLGYTDVIASTSGRVGMRRYDVGNVVGKNGQDVLTTITQLSPIYAEFSIPSNDFYYMRGLNKENIIVEFLLNNNLVYGHTGKIDFIDSVLDTQTSSIKTRAIVDNEAYKLLPNDFLRVRLKGFEAQNVIAIPVNALMQDSQGSYVYLAKGDTYEISRVTLGQNLKNSQVLITSGLKAGDVLIIDHLSKLNPNVSIVTQDSQEKSR